LQVFGSVWVRERDQRSTGSGFSAGRVVAEQAACSLPLTKQYNLTPAYNLRGEQAHHATRCPSVHDHLIVAHAHTCPEIHNNKIHTFCQLCVSPMPVMRLWYSTDASSFFSCSGNGGGGQFGI